MQLDDCLAELPAQLRAAAALGDARTQEIAAALGEGARSAMRLAVLRAVSGAAEEITGALFAADAPGAPQVRAQLDGADVVFHVTLTADEPLPDPVPEPVSDEGDATARISLRLPESLKFDVERAAEEESLSVNSWLVRAARLALAPRSGWGSPAGAPWGVPSGWPAGGGHGARRISGWVTG
ncbi:MAG: hypothetical protein FWD74_06495 [Actinomycetia bacterium]|nr:hypothetical protein [Actinomycetes bacterium]